MTKLTSNNGEEIYESKDIIKDVKIFYEEVKVFYERLCYKRRIEDCKILDMAQDIPMLTLQEKTSLEGVITLVKASVLYLKYENITEDLVPTDLLLISSKDQPEWKVIFC